MNSMKVPFIQKNKTQRKTVITNGRVNKFKTLNEVLLHCDISPSDGR